MGHFAATNGITAEDVQDLIIATLDQCDGQANRVPQNRSNSLPITAAATPARTMCAFAWGIALIPRTPTVSSLHLNGMAEAFVRTFKGDYVRMNPWPNG